MAAKKPEAKASKPAKSKSKPLPADANKDGVIDEGEATQAAQALAEHKAEFHGSFEARVEQLMAGTERSHMDGMRREDAERQAAAEGLKHRGR